jgi:hypothetical protein
LLLYTTRLFRLTASLLFRLPLQEQQLSNSPSTAIDHARVSLQTTLVASVSFVRCLFFLTLAKLAAHTNERQRTLCRRSTSKFERCESSSFNRFSSPLRKLLASQHAGFVITLVSPLSASFSPCKSPAYLSKNICALAEYLVQVVNYHVGS